MIFKWLKSIMPKGIYGRSALILLLPVITIQFVVSVVFIQRHFEGVTQQMTSNVTLEINHILATINTADTPAEARLDIDTLAIPLGYAVQFRDGSETLSQTDTATFYDLSGTSVIETLHRFMPDIISIDLLQRGRVHVVAQSDKGVIRVSFSRKRVSASNPHQLLVLMIFTSLLISIVSILFMRNQVRPIRRLASAADSFGRGINVDYRPAGATEVRSAGRSFLDMRDRIERQIEQRTLMLSGVSHDMRTPITRLKLGLAMLDDTEETQALIGDVDQMERMLEEFLAFSRGDSTEEATQIDPIELAEDLAADAQRGEQSVELLIKLPKQKHPLTLRPMAVRRALENLLNNAARYGKHVRLTLGGNNTHVHFIIEDDGPGIPKPQRDEALRPFIRLDRARNQNQGGVGLGLSIAIDIASSHGGSLTLSESHDLGGLKATFSLPR